MAKHHPRSDDIIGEVGEGNTSAAIVARCDVGIGVVHVCIITGLGRHGKNFLGFIYTKRMKRKRAAKKIMSRMVSFIYV